MVEIMKGKQILDVNFECRVSGFANKLKSERERGSGMLVIRAPKNLQLRL